MSSNTENKRTISEYFRKHYSFLLQKDWLGSDHDDPKFSTYFGDGNLEISESDALIYIFQAEWLKSRFFRKTLRKLIGYNDYDSMYLKNRYLYAKKAGVIYSFPLLLPIIRNYSKFCLINVLSSLIFFGICILFLNIAYNFSWHQIIMAIFTLGFIWSCMRAFGYLVDFLNTLVLRIIFKRKSHLKLK